MLGFASSIAPSKETLGPDVGRSWIEAVAINDQPSSQPGGALSIEQAIALAEQHQAAGELGAAEALCRQILRANGRHAPAMHLMGVVQHQAGRLADAIEWVARAVRTDGRVALWHCNLGEMHRQAANAEQALAEGNRALELDPNLAQAWNNVGILHYEADAFEEAVRHYRRAIALVPGYVEAISNLGNALRALLRHEEALEAYRRALQLQPGHVDALNNMGTALRDLGRRQEAEQAYSRALMLKPDSPAVINNLALAYKERDLLEDAAVLLIRSMVLDPAKAQTMTYLALVRLDQKRVEDAEIAATRALEMAPEDGEALNAMGLVRFEQQDTSAALDFFRRAVERKPALADAHNNIANILKEEGQLDAALAAYEQAIALDPREAAYYLNYSDPKKFTEGDACLLAMEEMARNAAGASKLSRQRLNFALAKAYDDLGRRDESFACLTTANQLKRESVPYDEAQTLQAFDRIAEVFDRKLVTRAKGGWRSSVPVFIVGMPRSGTTLVEQILGSHPEVHPAGELSDFNWLVDQTVSPRGGRFVYPDDAARMASGQLDALGQAYVERLRRRDPGAARITDKMPANFLFLGLIHMALPAARIIHLQRDPIDTCMSCYSKLFSGDQNFSYDLGELGRYYRRYVGLMAHWRGVLPKGVMLEVRYEDVVADLEGQARRMIAHVGLDWDDRCLAFHETRRPVRTASASQVRRPIYKSSTGRSQAYAAHLGALVEALGDVLPEGTAAAARGEAAAANG
jgi:tetratricopeptide (TPR) repeat protein